jgi:hypothetical protein
MQQDIHQRIRDQQQCQYPYPCYIVVQPECDIDGIVMLTARKRHDEINTQYFGGK